jgi:mobilome CxxCx(11)CxxC protein
MGYGFDSDILKLTIALAIPATILQLIISIFAVVFKWDEELAYSYEASQDYNSLSTLFKRIAEFPENDFENFRSKFEKLEVHYEQRSKQDAKHSVKEWELRKAMRYSLRQFQRKCVGCNEVPTSMESTECNVCGKFESQLKKRIKKWTRKLYMS